MATFTRWSRRATLSGMLATAGAVAFPSVIRAQSPVKLNVGFTAINEYAGLFVAKDQGFFAKRGLDVDLTLIANNATIPAALISNSIQLGTPSVTTLLQAVDGGIPLQFLCGAGVLTAAKPSVGLVAKAGAKIETAKDLAGKRVAVPGLNALFHIIARQWMLKGGQDPKSVSFVETPFAQMFDVLRGGQVDAVVAAEPARSRILNANIGVAVGNILDAIMDNALSGNYSTTKGFIAANGKVLIDFRAAIEEGHQFAASNPAEALASTGKYLKLPADVLATLPPPILRSAVDREQVEFWVKITTDQGLVRNRLVVDDLIARPVA